MILYDVCKTAVLHPFIHKRGVQCYIISYPKCGRTWLRLLIGKALCDQFSLPPSQMLDTYALTAVPPVLRTHFTHDYADIRLGYRYDRLPANKSAYAGAKVIFLVRDVRDTLVSSYFQATRRVNRFQGPMADFVRDARFGVKKILAFYNLWYKNQHVPRNFLLLRYEDLHHDPAGALRRTLQFMEMAPLEETAVETAVSFAAFDNMKKMESKAVFKDDKMQPGRPQDAASFKLRQGKIGGYAEYLTAVDLAYVNEMIQEMGGPFATMYNTVAGQT